MGSGPVGLAAAGLMVLTACSGADTAGDVPGTTAVSVATTTNVCPDPATARPGAATDPACAEQRYLDALTGKGGELTAEQRLAFGRNLCGYGASLNPQVSLDAADFVAQTATNWEVDKRTVQEILDAAGVLCPSSIATIRATIGGPDQLAVTLRAGGDATQLQVSYPLPGGLGTTQESVTSPWQQVVDYERTTDELSLAVSDADGGPVSCALEVNGVEAVTNTSEDGGVVCAATFDDLVAKAAG